jgi:hypothetical protein
MRDESRTPIYQAFFSYQDARQRKRTWGELKQQNVGLYPPAAAEDVRLWFLAEPGGVLGGLTYNTDVFEAPRAEHWVQGYLELLESAMHQPHATLRAVAGHETLGKQDAQPATRPAGLSGVPRAAASHPPAEQFTPTEAQLAQIWSELIGIDRIERTDNFFDLGGHSLLVMQAIARMRSLTHKPMQPRAYVLENLAQIAARYEIQAAEAVQRPGLIKRLFGGGGRHA